MTLKLFDLEQYGRPEEEKKDKNSLADPAGNFTETLRPNGLRKSTPSSRTKSEGKPMNREGLESSKKVPRIFQAEMELFTPIGNRGGLTQRQKDRNKRQEKYLRDGE